MELRDSVKRVSSQRQEFIVKIQVFCGADSAVKERHPCLEILRTYNLCDLEIS